jgi:protein-L-isoaspartate(D-aspartate) O-methyltransferase
VLASAAAARLAAMVSGSVIAIEGDGSLGYPPHAPYDAIVVAAAAPELPASFISQLAEGGRLVIPVGSLEAQELFQVRKVAGCPVSRSLGFCRFVPLTGSLGWRLE